MNEELLDDALVDLDVNAPTITNDRAEFPFPTIGQEALAGKIQKYLEKDGYKIESGSPTRAVYGKGNKTLRVLFGAFVKRFTWGIQVLGDENQSRLIFTKDEKGYWGGVIGVSQVKTEWNRIISSLTAYHTKHSN